MRAILRLERLDKDYRLLEKREQPSRSFVAGFLRLLYVQHAAITSGAPYAMPDITGANRNVDMAFNNVTGVRGTKGNLFIGAPPGNSGIICNNGHLGGATGAYINQMTLLGQNVGIVIGTGVNAITPTDVALQTKIAHGRAAGQMEYGGCELVGITFADPNGEFSIRRYFTNISGGGITVQEVGIYSTGTIFATSASAWAWSFCIARDLTVGIAVANTELLRVTYVPQITV